VLPTATTVLLLRHFLPFSSAGILPKQALEKGIGSPGNSFDGDVAVDQRLLSNLNPINPSILWEAVGGSRT
jgi:hypothetical protein